jgi:hypothetical protein
MSQRASQQKKASRLAKALRNTPPTYFDLVDYVVHHHRIGYKKPTKTQARQMILDGKVMVGSHRVGRVEVEALPGVKEWVLAPHIPSEQRKELVILP